MSSDTIRTVQLTEKEQWLIERLRKIGWGEVTIFMENNEPVRIVRGLEGEKFIKS